MYKSFKNQLIVKVEKLDQMNKNKNGFEKDIILFTGVMSMNIIDLSRNCQLFDNEYDPQKALDELYKYYSKNRNLPHEKK